jgi:hypothetical protein
MAVGILIGADQHVANWAFTEYQRVPHSVDRAFGVIDNGIIVGAAIFRGYNQVDAELSYFGKWSLTRGIIRCLAEIALYELRLARCTVIVPKRPGFLLKKLPKLGFRFEGVQRRFYGPTDAARDTGCRFVLFKEDLERLAGTNNTRAA